MNEIFSVTEKGTKMAEVKHGGCYDCKGSAQPILTTIYDRTMQLSLAVCDACKAQRQKGQ